MRRLYDEAAIGALDSNRLVPPSRAASFIDGPAAELRDTMARFSSGDEHRHRRAAVEGAIAHIDTDLLVREVTERTQTATAAAGSVDAVADIGLVVPTLALLVTLGVPADQLAGRADDVRIVVATIGRGALVSANTEAATRRLTTTFADHAAGAVAAISMLYQNHDATAALFASTLLARATGIPRENALARTERIALESLTIADEFVEANEVVEVSLDGDGLEFGLGDHACPGQALAVLIVDAMIGALEVLGCNVDTAAMAVGRDGRAAALPLSS
jgi:cytochrome P450